MGATPLFSDLVDHLGRTSLLTRSEAARVVAEVLTYFCETTEQVVRRRHRELQAAGLRNEAIFGQLAAELRLRRVAVAPLTDRQLRRIIYG